MRSIRILPLLLSVAPMATHAAPPEPVAARSLAETSRPDDTPAAAAAAPAALPAGIVLPTPLSSTLIIATDIPGTPPVDNKNDTTNNPYLQINGTNGANTGYLEFRYGADGKGVYNVIVKTRGTAMNDYAAVQSGDRVVTTAIQAGTGGQSGHVGTEQWIIDGTAIVPGEVNGRWVLATGTGVSSGPASQTPYPTRFGMRNAIMANSWQQVYFPGGVTGTGMPAGTNYGGWVVIGAGSAAPGLGPLKFLSAGAQTLTTPEPGAFEVDAAATPYFTRADGVRRAFVLDDTGTPTVALAASAGSGASVQVDAAGSAGTITLVTGAAPVSGAFLTLTYAHPYAAASYPVFSFANAAGPASAAQTYVTGTRSGFTLGSNTALAPNTTYLFNYQAPGR